MFMQAVHIHATLSELIPTVPGELQPRSDGAGTRSGA